MLGHKLLTDWDEGIYAEISREMLGGGWRAWITPHWNGQVWFEKPPLMLWITAAFFRVFGMTEFWARAGSTLSGVAIVGVLHGWVARREGPVAAWIGTVALLSTTGFLHVCRMGEMDVLLSLGCVMSLIGLVEVAEGRTRGWFGFWVGFAVAAMTKGSASVVILLTVLVLGVVERGKWRFGRDFWLGMLGFAVLVLPWHLAMWHSFGAAFLREYFGFHVLARATRAIEGHETPWWYYGRVLLVSAMPWVLVFPFAAWRGWRRAEMRVWVVFALVVLVFFSVVRTRLPHYVAPVYPAMAVVVAVFLRGEVEWLRGMPVRRRVAVAVAIAVICGGGLALTAGGRKRLHSVSGTGGWTAAEEREAIGLLRGLQGDGPVLTWWTEPRRSVATSVFYSRRVVEQVGVGIDPASARERYTLDRWPLEEAMGDRPVTILLETKLVPEVPGEFVYSRLAVGPTMEIGTIRRRENADSVRE